MKHLNKKHKFLISMVQFFVSIKKARDDFIDELSGYIGNFFESLSGLILYLITAPIFFPMSLINKILDKYTILNEVWADYSNYQKHIKDKENETLDKN